MTADPVKRRRRREDLFVPLVSLCVALFVVVCFLSFGVLRNSSKANTAATDAKDAAHLALTNTRRVDAAERGFCARLQDVRDGVNRNGAIIYVVLGTVAENSSRGPRPANERDYRSLADLPAYLPATDCAKAVDDPLRYRPPRSRAFRLIDPNILKAILAGRPPHHKP